jgi:hypothetical protein
VNILILTAADDEIREIGDVSAENKIKYADKHGYAFTYFREYPKWINWEGGDRSWHKIPLILKCLESYDWIWWTDADSLIRNFYVRLEDILDTDKDLVIGRDHQPFTMPTAPSIPVDRVGMINAGNFFIRNCEWSRGFLAQVMNSTWIERIGYYHREQGAIIRLLEDPENEAHVKYTHAREFNSYSNHIPGNELWKLEDVYQPGDFVCHWAGTNPSNREVLQEMKAKRPKFCILTGCVGEMRKSIGDYSAVGKRAYATKHKYDFVYVTELADINRDGSWNKIPWLQQILNDYEWVFWSDADCIITNSEIRLEGIIGRCVKDLIIGWDCQPCLNAGNFFIRNCDWSWDFLRRVYARHDWGDFTNGRWNRGGLYSEREQGVMMSFLEVEPDRSHAAIQPMRHLGFSYRHNKLKSDPKGFAWAVPDTYVRGDFLKHYGGWWVGEAARLSNMWGDPSTGYSNFIP